MKKLFRFFTLFTLIFTLFIPTFANSKINNTEITKYSITIPIEEFKSQNEVMTHIGTIDDYTSYELFRTKYAPTNLSVSIFRSGKTNHCELYLFWNGTELYNRWKFSRINIDNGELLNYKKYGPIYGNTISSDATNIGSVKLGDVSIPCKQKSVIITFSNLLGYNVTKGYWLLANLHPGFVGIK